MAISANVAHRPVEVILACSPHGTATNLPRSSFFTLELNQKTVYNISIKKNYDFSDIILMPQYFTKEGLQKLKDELHYLKTVKNKEIVKLIAEAAAFGDLKENAAYHDARDKMSFLRMRVAELEGAINEAIVREKINTGKVEVGSDIKILFGKDEEKYQIVAPTEADILKNKISYDAPLGKVLMGRKVGDEFEYQAGSRKVKIKILEIS